MKKLLLLLIFSSSIYSNEYLFECPRSIDPLFPSPEPRGKIITILKINTAEQYMEATTYGGFDFRRIEYVTTRRWEGNYKETDRIIRIGQGASKSIEHPDGKGTIEVWTKGYASFDKYAGIYEYTYDAYGRTFMDSCKAHTKFIP
jgi:hypothetical protein